MGPLKIKSSMKVCLQATGRQLVLMIELEGCASSLRLTVTSEKKLFTILFIHLQYDQLNFISKLGEFSRINLKSTA